MLVLKKEISPDCTLLVCEIEKELEELISQFKEMGNFDEELKTLNKFKSNQRRLEWISTRLLISTFFNEKIKIYYDDFGKPYIKNKNYKISISHSKKLVVVSLCKNSEMGIDVEFMSNKIGRVALKFLHKKEIEQIDIENDILKLYLHWCAKEALYKVYGKKQLNFIDDLRIDPIDEQKGYFTGNIITDGKKTSYQMQYLDYKGYIIVWTKE